MLSSSNSNSVIALQHSQAIKSGVAQFRQVFNHLLNLYTKSRFIIDARKLFDDIPSKDIITWTTLLSAYSRSGSFSSALSLIPRMISDGVIPNQFTLATAFRCCVTSPRKGREIHGWIFCYGIRSDIVLNNSMVDFYFKIGDFLSARKVFDGMFERSIESWNIMINAHFEMNDPDGSLELFKRLPNRDVVSWNTVISGYTRIGSDCNIALKLLHQMAVEGDAKFNEFTFSTALSLFANLGRIDLGKEIHGRIIRAGFKHLTFIQNSLIDMYSKCGNTSSASIIFNSMSHLYPKSLSLSSDSMERMVSWSSMVAGYIQNGRGEEALHLFQRMHREDIKIDQFTFTSITSACSDAGNLEQGRQVHGCIEKSGHVFDVLLETALTDMYAKCGSLEDACIIFNTSNARNVVLWTSLIVGFSLYGKGNEAIQVFQMMIKDTNNICPNEVTFVGVLNACSHAFLVEEGRRYFNSMQEDYGLKPNAEHYTAMADLLGRAGRLTEAIDFIIENNVTHLTSAWKAILSGCRTHNNLEMAKWVGDQLIQLEPSDSNSYILLANMYSGRKRWMDASRLRRLMHENRATDQNPGQAWIQLKGRVHVFVSGDRIHPQIDEVCCCLHQFTHFKLTNDIII